MSTTVPPVDGLKKSLADARNGKDPLDDQGAGYDDWRRPSAVSFHEYAKKLCEGYRFSQ